MLPLNLTKQFPLGSPFFVVAVFPDATSIYTIGLSLKPLLAGNKAREKMEGLEGKSGLLDEGPCVDPGKYMIV